MPDLSQLVKAYDIRGVVPTEFDTTIAHQAGAAFVHVTNADRIVMARDMRESSGPLSAAFARGAMAQGADVIDVGLGSTDFLYFASGTLDLPGAMFTASHNPAQYNGIKLCHAGAAPVGQDTGLAEIRDLLEHGIPTQHRSTGTLTQRDMLADYATYLRNLVDLTDIRPLTVVVDAGNGMGGHMVPVVLGDQHLAALPLDIVPMYFELDGTFPNHEANPLEPANLLDLQAKVRETGADIGLAFDGDADRCFVIDEAGQAVPPSAIVGLIATRELAKHPGAAIVHNVITSAAVPEIVREHGGNPIRERVGHSFMKQTMAETGAVFGGEHSGHYYFKEFWRADTGMLAALHVLAALGEQHIPLSKLTGQYTRYVASGEVNSKIDDVPATLARVEAAYAQYDGAEADHLDGLTITLGKGLWFNLRPSNTEPMLRLNVEAPDHTTMTDLHDHVLRLVRQT